MSKYILLSFFLVALLHSNLCAQNLVPNPSFEDMVGCPDNLDEVSMCVGWSSFGRTPDYFNSCNHSWLGVPQNGFGYQNAANGNAYCGICTFNFPNPIPSYREFVGRTLSSPLIIGAKYFVSIKVSLADSSNYATNNLGILFSNTQYNDTSSTPSNNISSIYSTSVIQDTSEWKIISGIFIADSSYSFIIIGNFFNDANTDTSFVGSNFSLNSPHEAYYYIDDVCVSTDSLECDLNPEGIYSTTKNEINIYPNPASNKIYFKNNAQNEFDCSLINMMGEVVGTYTVTAANSIDVSTIPQGIYLLQLKFRNQLIQKKQIILH